LLLHTSRFPSCYDDISGLCPKSRTTRQFSEIFRKIFEFNSSIMIIGIGNYKEIEDEYGNYKDVLLAKSAMERET